MNQINYPWHLAPDWAEYAAIDQNGFAFWFEEKPFILIEKILVWESGKCARIVDWAIPENIYWTKSLQKRPNT